MIDLNEAINRVLALFSPLDHQMIPLTAAHGRVLAKDAIAQRDQPPFAASAMDGYALRNADLANNAPLKVIGQSVAGRAYDGQVDTGQAVRIFTGAPVPAGADKILIQEDCTRTGDHITPNLNIDPARYIRAMGADFKAGMTLPAHTRLSANHIGLLAAMNIAQPCVYRQPKIALIATGDELVAPGDQPKADQIICSNSDALAALIAQWGGQAQIMPIARDNMGSLRQILTAAHKDCDAIVTTGGASVGDHDLVAQAATDLGATLDFHRIAMRPGKPVFAGHWDQTPLLGLPGNPVSAVVCAHVFLRPAMEAMQGITGDPLPLLSARLGAPVDANGPRAHFMRARLQWDANGPIITAFDRQDSALLTVLAQADALLLRPAHAPQTPKGTQVEFLPLKPISQQG